jgi:hypothetical protein
MMSYMVLVMILRKQASKYDVKIAHKRDPIGRMRQKAPHASAPTVHPLAPAADSRPGINHGVGGCHSVPVSLAQPGGGGSYLGDRKPSARRSIYSGFATPCV